MFGIPKIQLAKVIKFWITPRRGYLGRERGKAVLKALVHPLSPKWKL
jgi:hypothetical protein